MDIPHLSQRVHLDRNGVFNGKVTDYANAFASLNIDNHYDAKTFKRNFQIDVKRCNRDIAEFDIIGIDAPIVNSLRRTIIAEVATVAIERVVVYQNTGVIHDENLAHRLGLIPLLIDPKMVDFKDDEPDSEEIKFNLHITCDRDSKDTVSVYSRDLKWEPQSESQQILFEGQPPKPVYGDILIAKLRPGQEIEAECYCRKGYGKEHAKWSPVSTAWYRLMPDIQVSNVKGEEARMLVERCPKNVFDVEDSIAVVKDARSCTTCRECLEAIPDGRVQLGKIRNHFIFTIESVGVIPASELFVIAIQNLREKCKKILDLLRA